jgi:ABC-type polysaccharide/polyol phosphate export permease
MIFTKAELHYSIVLAIIPMILIAILSTGVGLLLAAFAVKFRDLVHLYGVFTTALMYLSPIIYPMEILPEKVAMVVRINPITNILEIFRGVVMYNSMPGLEVVLMATIPSLLFLFIGFYAFYKKQDTFILNV